MLFLEINNLDLGIVPIISLISLFLSTILTFVGIAVAIGTKGERKIAKQILSISGVLLLIGLGTCGIGFAIN